MVKQTIIYPTPKSAAQEILDLILTDDEDGGEPYDLEYIIYLLNKNLSVTIYEDQTLVGFCMVDIKGKFQSTATIAFILVKKTHRGKGLGRKLMELSINNIKSSLRNAKIHLQVSIQNLRAYKLYYSLGFRKIQFLPDYYKEMYNGYPCPNVTCYDAYLMELQDQDKMDEEI